MNVPIIIIGAGAAGLMAGRELSVSGHSVTILEAAAEPGGRIRTLHGQGFSAPIETGAEFVHGTLPLTLALLREAEITHTPVEEGMARVKNGVWINRDPFGQDWDRLMHEMQALKEDISIAAFLEIHFPGSRYADLRDSIRSFAEGYDLADIDRASTLALYKEWNAEQETEYRVHGGYSRLIHFLEAEILRRGSTIVYAAPAERIDWSEGRVSVTVQGGKTYEGSRLIITASLGVLQTITANGSGSAEQLLDFHPSIPAQAEAIGKMGYGTVIKILMEFNHAFWKRKMDHTGFVLSDERVPTWWTQSGDHENLITGWLAGEAMKKFLIAGESEKLDICLHSLARIFECETAWLKEQLTAWCISDWRKASYVRGGYSFETLDSAAARRLLMRGVGDTLFFAGEAFYDGASPGTVEAALFSGKDLAKKIIAQS